MKVVYFVNITDLQDVYLIVNVLYLNIKLLMPYWDIYREFISSVLSTDLQEIFVNESCVFCPTSRISKMSIVYLSKHHPFPLCRSVDEHCIFL